MILDSEGEGDFLGYAHIQCPQSWTGKPIKAPEDDRMTSPVWAASETQGWEEMVKPGVSSADQEAGSPRANRQSTLTTTGVHKPPIIEDCKGQ